MKKGIAIALMILSFGVCSVFAQSINKLVVDIASFEICVDGNKKVLSNPVIVWDGKTYLPLRELADILGVNIEWIGEDQRIVIDTKTFEPSHSGAFLQCECVDYSFLGESHVDQSLFLNSYDPVMRLDNNELIAAWWEELSNGNDVYNFKNKYDVFIPETDMENYSIIVSLGREIENIRSFYAEPDSSPSSVAGGTVAIVSFAEEYHEDKLFYYTVKHSVREKSHFVNPRIMAPSYIVGEKEIYIGDRGMTRGLE